MKIHDVIQRSDEWFTLHQQYPLTSSKAQAIGNNGKGLKTLVLSKLSERYSTADKEYFSNKDTDRGNELESQARSIYEFETGNKVQEVGFITSTKISKVAGASTDGLVNKDGVLEIKCFDDTKHFDYIVYGLTVDSEYQWQCQMELLITGREWVDFAAYNPNFKQSLLVVRVYEDEEMRAKLKEGLKTGEELIKEIEAKLK